MTPDEVEANYNKTIKMVAPGIVAGYKYAKIVDYDLRAITPNGKGTATLEFFTKKPNVVYALSQVKLLKENISEG